MRNKVLQRTREQDSVKMRAVLAESMTGFGWVVERSSLAEAGHLRNRRFPVVHIF